MPSPSPSVMAGSAQNRSPRGEVIWRLQKCVKSTLQWQLKRPTL